MSFDEAFRRSVAKLFGKAEDDAAVTRIVHLRQRGELDSTFFRRHLDGEIDEYGNPTPRDPVAVDAAFDRLRRSEKPGLFLERVEHATRSRVGGLPDLPEGLDWPCPDGAPLAFLAQIDCSELPRAADLEWLPTTGTLFFFIAPGHAMTFAGDPKSSAVLYAREQGARLASAPIDAATPSRFVTFRLLPTLEQNRKHNQPGVIHPEDEDDLFNRIRALEGDRPWSYDQIGGWASPYQFHDMLLECEQIASGLHRDDPDYPRPDPDLPTRADLSWRLLLRLDLSTMDDWLWDDGGSQAYFWIREDDARAHRFSNVILLADVD